MTNRPEPWNDPDPYDIGAEILAHGGEAPGVPDVVLSDDADEATVDTLLRRRARALRDIRGVKSIVAERRAELDAYEADRLAGPQRYVELIEGAVIGWFRKARGKRKSVNLPSGVVASRAGSVALEVDDIDRAVEAIDALGEGWAIETTYKIAKADVRKADKTFAVGGEWDDDALEPQRLPLVHVPTGTVVEGVAWVRQPRSFKVKGGGE